MSKLFNPKHYATRGLGSASPRTPRVMRTDIAIVNDVVAHLTRTGGEEWIWAEDLYKLCDSNSQTMGRTRAYMKLNPITVHIPIIRIKYTRDVMGGRFDISALS